MKAKEEIKKLRNSFELKNKKWAKNCLDTIEEELEKKDNIIDLMTEELYEHRYQNNLDFFKDVQKAKAITTSKRDIKEYYEKEVEK